jgi:hypothetical protein
VNPIFLFFKRKGENILFACFRLNPKKKNHQEEIEAIIWHTTLQTKD